MNPWRKDKITIKIGTEVIDYPDINPEHSKVGFGVDCDYGGFSHIEGVHTVQQLKDLFSDIITDLEATMGVYNILSQKVKIDE